MMARLRGKLKKLANPSRRTLRIVVFSFGLLALAWQQIQATRLGYQVESARRQTQALQGRIAAMRMELQAGLSPAQLALQARARLGMQPANPEALRLLGVEQAASAADSILSRLLSLTWPWTRASA